MRNTRVTVRSLADEAIVRANCGGGSNFGRANSGATRGTSRLLTRGASELGEHGGCRAPGSARMGLEFPRFGDSVARGDPHGAEYGPGFRHHCVRLAHGPARGPRSVPEPMGAADE